MRLLAFTLVLGGCAQLAGVRPGMSESDAVRALGKPKMELDAGGGVRQLVFTTGPLGTQTFMVFVRDGTVERSQQVLTDDMFYRIHTGTTTKDEVQRLIGPPHRIVRFDNLKQDAWDYRFRDTWGYLADFSVMMDDRGIVAGKVTARIESGKDSGMSR
jgi:outer membrane protein assembly factor BamE (lipoprotein component of BamABCDE complex)